MKKIIITVIGASCILYAMRCFAIIYIWQDEKGAFQISDNFNQVPKEFQKLVGDKPEPKKEENGLGYWLDSRGNFHFYRRKQSALEIKKPGIEPKVPSGYNPLEDDSWKCPPNPEVWTKRVQKVLGADEILLDGGEVLKFSGIAFPEDLKNSEMSKEVIEYERNLLEGKTIKILFDKKRYDEKGRLLGLVFLGKDIFVNADLVLKGYARARIIPPNLEYMKLYQRLEDYARKEKLGIWKFLN